MNQDAADIMLDVDIPMVDHMNPVIPTLKFPHGMLYARKILNQLPALCIGRYCNEGDSNALDGISLGTVILNILHNK